MPLHIIGLYGKITRFDLLRLAPEGGKGIFLLPDNVPDCYLLPAYKHETNARGGLAIEGRPYLKTDDAGQHLDIRIMGIPTCDIGKIAPDICSHYWKCRPENSFAQSGSVHIAASFNFLEQEICKIIDGPSGNKNNDAYLFVPYGGAVKNNDDTPYTKRDITSTPSFGGAIGARGEIAIQLRIKIEENLLLLQRKYGSDIGKTRSKIVILPVDQAVTEYQNKVLNTTNP